MATAEAGDRREPPGLGPRTRRSTATNDMAGGGGEGKKGEREGSQLYVLSLPAAALPLPVAVSHLDSAVPRKARSCRPRAKPSGWWSFKLPLPSPPEMAKEEKASPPGPQRLRGRMRVPHAPDFDDIDAPVMEKEKPAKRARMCLQCGSAETPQWRSGPMGRATLCNACGVRLRAAGALRDPEHGPPLAKAIEQSPPPPLSGSPHSDSPPGSPIWEPHAAPREDVYLVRKPSKRQRKEAIIPPAPSIYLVKKDTKKKKTPKKQPWRPRKTAKKCLHCGSSSTPQWRHGPMGRSTLCNACGVRYRQGRLLPEYRPAASPTFTPSEHANRHREVIQLRRQRQDKSHHHHPPPLQPVGDDLVLVRRNKDPYPPTPLHQPLPQPMDDNLAAGNHNSAANAHPGCSDDLIDGVPSSLDSLLLDGPSAPLIVDGDEFVIN